MMNRISNRLTARFVAFAALLALVMAAPAVFAQENIEYAENGTEPVATFSATDQDGDAIALVVGRGGREVSSRSPAKWRVELQGVAELRVSCRRGRRQRLQA